MQPLGFLEGRSNRVDYWTSIAVLVALSVGFRLLFGGGGGVIQEFVLVMVAVPRLHDIGRSGWWAVAAFGIEWVGVSALVLVGGDQWATNSLWILGYVVLCVVVLGAWSGDPGENRFGPRPPSGLSWSK